MMNVVVFWHDLKG